MVSFGQHVRSYFSETSLHGLKYITEDERHIIERIVWVVLFTVSISLMVTFMLPGHSRLKISCTTTSIKAHDKK